MQRIHQGSRTSLTLKNQWCHQVVIGYSHSQHSPKGILEVHSQGIQRCSFRTIFQVSMLHQSKLATKSIKYSLDSSRPVFSIIHHTKIIKPSSIPILRRYTLHKTINTASRIKYRSAASLKESISQPFTYTSLH
ncbi:hypothetical protein O181_100324 [Austropuccinia psidii MF-1]|uniref:Uncharacterized protein n=1 Tax=Austropuccinia psidii MF-1 TaxID=1389203 RepID=A0A9Q3JEF6_9BASI|nr:hypothetical protein [Austropuccinia psidii MF-1]